MKIESEKHAQEIAEALIEYHMSKITEQGDGEIKISRFFGHDDYVIQTKLTIK